MKISFREVKLPSGATLKVAPASFSESKALYQAILEEVKSVSIERTAELGNIFKDIFCVGFSSKKIESCLWTCFQRCVYNSGSGDLKIDSDTFEPIAARQDYTKVCMEVAKENILPFAKSLYAEYLTVLSTIDDTQP